MEIHVRKAGLADVPEIIRVIGALRLNVSGFIWGEEQFIRRQVASGEYQVAERNGMVAGIISVRVRDRKVSIETLAVSRESRRQGIGSALVNFAKRFAKERGAKALYAGSFFEYGADGFYENLGFKKWKRPGKYRGHPYHVFLLDL